MIETLQALRDTYEKIEKEIEELQNELMKLSPKKGWTEYRWVKNKVGKKYWYYYYCYWENGKKRSVYLGKRIPSSLLQGFKDRARAKAILARLRSLYEQKIEIVRRIEVAENILYSI